MMDRHEIAAALLSVPVPCSSAMPPSAGGWCGR
jgi:hypothetical protein